MPRPKAFSGKQKKEQLKAKRERKRSVEHPSDDDSDRPSEEREVTLGGDKAGVRSAFASEAKSALDQRRERSYRPLAKRRHDHAVPFASWLHDPFAVEPTPCLRLPYCFPFPSEGRLEGSAEEIETRQQMEFNEWKEAIERVGAEGQLVLNQFERNIDVWRQLWRVVLRSQVIVIVVDSRFPIVHLPMSVVEYVAVRHKRPFVVLLNKSDLLPSEVLEEWKEWIRSAVRHFLDTHETSEVEFAVQHCCCTPDKFVVSEDTLKRRKRRQGTSQRQANFRSDLEKQLAELSAVHDDQSSETSSCDERGDSEHYASCENFAGKGRAQKCLAAEGESRRREAELTRHAEVGALIQKLLEQCKALVALSGDEGTSIGLIGHPNVGKSSLINAISGVKKVSASATAGHTKHLQSIPLADDGVTLMDCPGVCFPLIGLPAPTQALFGTHQIAQVRDPASSVAYLASHLDIEKLFGLKRDLTTYDEATEWSAYELCEAFAARRGFKQRRGRWDIHRGAIQILQEVCDGRVPFYFLPPSKNESEAFELIARSIRSLKKE